MTLFTLLCIMLASSVGIGYFVFGRRSSDYEQARAIAFLEHVLNKNNTKE